MGGRGWWVIGLGLCAFVFVDRGTALAQVSVTESSLKKTLDCGGKDATVSGSLNELTLTGECPTVSITGSGNTVAVEAVGSIRVIGTNNKVTWQRATLEKRPRVAMSGLGNSVTQAVGKGAAAAGKASEGESGASGAAGASGASDASGSSGAANVGPASTRKASGTAKSGSASSSKSASRGGAPVVVSDNNATKTIDCRERGVSVMGNGNTLTLRGTCSKVDVTGNDNIISVETVQAIETTGNHNRVTWNHAAEGDEPSTSDLGTGNAIRRATAPLQ